MRLLSVLTLSAMLATPAAIACTLPAGADAMRKAAIAQINAERRAEGLPALRANAQLMQAAQAHACDSAKRRKMDHAGSDGSRFTTRINRTGYVYAPGSPNENVAFGYPTAAGVVQGWMTSSGHRRNILSRKISETGIGVAEEPGNRLHWVLVSASRAR